MKLTERLRLSSISQEGNYKQTIIFSLALTVMLAFRGHTKKIGSGRKQGEEE